MFVCVCVCVCVHIPHPHHECKLSNTSDTLLICTQNCRFSSVDTSGKAITALHKRWFGGKVVNAAYYDEAKFNAGDYTG